MNMTPYFEQDGVTLYHGDCREILPRLDPGVVRAVVTDPPYCSGGFNEAGKKAAAGMGLRSETVREVGWFVNDNMTTQGICWLLSFVAGWSRKVCKDGSTLTVFTDWRMVPALAPAIEGAGWRYQNLIVWQKPNTGLGTGFRPCHELALHFSNGTPEYFATDGSNVINEKRVGTDERLHQTQKPVGLMAEIIRVTSAEGETILDPFAGSGTTLLAARLEGRQAVGIEISERYCEIAANRLRQKLLF